MRDPAGTTATSSRPSSGRVPPISLPPPNAPVAPTTTCQARPREALAVVAADAAAQRRRGDGGLQRADGVGERAEARLVRPRLACGDDRQPGRRGVDERPLAGERELGVARGGVGVARQRAGRFEVQRQLERAREVVRRADGHDGERDADLGRQQRRQADRPVAAGDDDPVGRAFGAQRPHGGGKTVGVEPVLAARQVSDRGHADLRAPAAEQLGETLGIGRRARLRIGDEGKAHPRSCLIGALRKPKPDDRPVRGPAPGGSRRPVNPACCCLEAAACSIARGRRPRAMGCAARLCGALIWH